MRFTLNDAILARSVLDLTQPIPYLDFFFFWVENGYAWGTHAAVPRRYLYPRRTRYGYGTHFAVSVLPRFSLKEPSLAPYHALAHKLEEKFGTFEISYVVRSGNHYADALATLGLQNLFEGPKVDVTINKRSEPITDLLKEEFEEQLLDTEDWRTPIKAKLMSPEGVANLKTLKDYVLIAGDFYCRLPGGVLARYVSL